MEVLGLELKLKFYSGPGSLFLSTAVSALRPPFSDRWLLRERNMGERERKRARFHLVAAVPLLHSLPDIRCQIQMMPRSWGRN